MRRSEGLWGNGLAGLTEDASDDGWTVVRKKQKNKKTGCPLSMGFASFECEGAGGSVPSGVFRAPVCK